MHACEVLRRAFTVVLVGAIACHPAPARSPMAPAGEIGSNGGADDGAGELGQASARFLTADTVAGFGGRAPRGYLSVYGGDPYGGSLYGGAMYGGDPYGGTGYANWTVPPLNYQPPDQLPRYRQEEGLSAAIEGVVTWTGTTPAKLSTSCGVVDNTVRVGGDKRLRGVLVYIERITVGRPPLQLNRPAVVGGVVAKRGCSLVPAVQLVSPMPATMSIHGDTSRTRVRVTPAGGKSASYELQEGGLVDVDVQPGVNRIDGEDNKLGAAWVVGLDTPYYALTDDAGRYRIDELASGRYDVTFWQPPVASVGPDGALVYGAPIIARRSIAVAAARTAQLNVSLGR
jgi:hypothetical protein